MAAGSVLLSCAPICLVLPSSASVLCFSVVPEASLSPLTAIFLPHPLLDTQWRLEELAAARDRISPAQRPPPCCGHGPPDSWPCPLGVPGEHPSLPPSSHPNNLRNTEGWSGSMVYALDPALTPAEGPSLAAAH